MRHRKVSAYHGVSTGLLIVKGTLAGKMAAAIRRQRRAPLVALRSAHADRRDGGARGPRGPRGGRAVFVTLAGPGELDIVGELIESIYAYEGEDARIVVVDDGTADVRRARVQAHHPRVDVVRPRWPTGGPPRQSTTLALGLGFALAAYEFDVVCKVDTDALVTGPGLTERAAERFAREPRLGLLGTVGLRADGVPDDYTWDAWLLEHERRWSPTVRDRLRRAEAGGYDGRKIHGGVYLLSRRALDSLAAAGDLRRSPPWWSQIPEDLWMTLGVTAAGYGLGSWGGPGEPVVASASKFLPVPLEEIGPRGVLAVHSVRRGAHGEPEAVVRAALRARQPPVTAA